MCPNTKAIELEIDIKKGHFVTLVCTVVFTLHTLCQSLLHKGASLISLT